MDIDKIKLRDLDQKQQGTKYYDDYLKSYLKSKKMKKHSKPQHIHIIDYDLARDMYMYKDIMGEVHWADTRYIQNGNYVIMNEEDANLVLNQRRSKFYEPLPQATTKPDEANTTMLYLLVERVCALGR